MESRDEYIRRMHETLDRLSAEIDHLSDRAGKVGAEAKTEVAARLAEAKVKRDAALARIDELKNSGDGAWQDLKAGAELARKALGDAVDSARARFR